MIRLERNDARILRQMYNVKPGEMISGELRTRLKLKNIVKCLHDRRLGSSRKNGRE